MMPDAAILPGLAAALLAVNAWTWRSFRHDKTCAIERRRRVPEADLLLFAALGGTPAAFLARRRYRHKTRKQPFTFRLQLIATMQAGAIAGLLIA